MLGFNFDAFSSTIYASQKELTALSNLKSEERKKIIRKLIGLEKIDQIEKEIIFKIRELNRDIKSFKEIIPTDEEIKELNDKKEELLKSIEELKKSLQATKKRLENDKEIVKKALKEVESWQKLKDDYNTLNRLLELDNNSLQNFTKNLQSIKENLTSLKSQEKFYLENISKKDEFLLLEKEIAKLQTQKELNLKKEGLLKEQDSLREQLKGAKKELKELSSKIGKEGLIKQQLQSAQNRLATLQNDLQKIENQEKRLIKEESKHTAIINNTKKQIDGIVKIGKSGTCPTCLRPLLEEYDKVVNSLNNTIETITKNYLLKIKKDLQQIDTQKNSLKTVIKDAQDKLNSINSEFNIIKTLKEQFEKKQKLHDKILQKGLQNKAELEKLKSVNYDYKKHQELIDKKEKLEPIYKKLISLQKLLEQIPTLQKEEKTLQEKIENLQKEIEIKRANLQKHKFDNKKLLEAKSSYQKALNNKEETQILLKNQEVENAKLNSALSAINDRLKEIEQLKQKLSQKEQNRDDYEVLKLFLSDFKTKINSQITPRISQIASELFYEITAGKYQFIEVDDDFNFFIYDNSKKFPIERFSGGEIDLANLVLRIAISKTLNELNGNINIGFLAFDEIFGSQDEQRRYALMESFNKIGEHYRQIFLISNEREIKEMFEFVIELS